MEDMVIDKKESKLNKLVSGFKSAGHKIADGFKKNAIPFATGLLAGFVAGHFLDIDGLVSGSEEADSEEAPFDEEA